MIGNKSCALDTNIVIDLFRGRKNIADKINELEKVYVPIPVLGELYLGAENSSRKAHHLAQIDVLLRLSEILHTSNETAKIYGRIKVQLKRKGKPIPENDIWIAALAMEHELTLITRDQHFIHLPELTITEW
jgi:tRNA(fMet)-specific endonuclease VapC